MHDRLSTTNEGLPNDLRSVVDGYAARGEWASAVAVLLVEAERRTEVRERVVCYLQAAAIYEQQFGNSAEAQAVLEYVLALSPYEPAARHKLGELYARARYQDKLRWLAEEPQKIAAQARVPRPPASFVAAGARAANGPSAEAAGAILARIGAGGLFIALPAAVTAANMGANAVVEPHDNGGGLFGWLTFTGLDLAFCAAFVACAWLPARWALRRVDGSALFTMLALLSATFLIAMVPTLGWSAIDATNVLLDSNPPSLVKVRVIDHERWGKGAGYFPVVREHPGGSGSTLLRRSLRLEPLGSEHALLRGGGFFRRPYYLAPER